LFLGVYGSAVSVARDTRLRHFIRNYLEGQGKFLDIIATAELEQSINDKVVMLTKRLHSLSPDFDNVSLSENDYRRYLEEVLKEKGLKK
jgi:hypothetical protein